MFKFSPTMLFVSALYSSILSAQAPVCHKEELANNSQMALACYLAEPEKITQPWVFIKNEQDKTNHVSISTYELTSQFWPKPAMSTHGTFWKHTLVIYQPDTVTTNYALLVVDDGIRYPLNHTLPHSRAKLELSSVANKTHSVVVDLQDVPNQYLTLDDNIARKEDGIIAYTWNRFLDNPGKNAYWPLHLPMTKAVIKAMDATQQIAASHHLKIDKFVVTGASKRGLTTWLAAIADDRINAIIPIVIDVLNTKENFQHIYEVYNHEWPMALHDYVEAKITDRVQSPEFLRLMQIEDPLSYLYAKDRFYQQRFQIPKYIISASGDDFFVPDSLNFYYDRLPGDNHVRMVPNQPHYIDVKAISSSMLAYYQSILHQQHRPLMNWKMYGNQSLSVVIDAKPISVKLWEAVNPNARDFRLISGVRYTAQELTGECVDLHCEYIAKITSPAKGWKASFVEVTFPTVNGETLVYSTTAHVS